MELLIVMGIVALLVATLLPAASRARELARSIECLGNLRQMTVASQSYGSRYRGSYPVAYYFGYQGTTSYSYSWDLTTVWGPGQPTKVVAGLLWEGQDLSKVQQCPSFEGAANWLNDPYTGYNYNTSYIGHGQFEMIPAPARLADVADPRHTVLFGDGQWSGGANKFMRAPFANPGDRTFSGRYAGTQGFRHLGRTNVAFCDGHAESLTERFTNTSDGPANVASGTGFVSVDNSLYDLK